MTLGLDVLLKPTFSVYQEIELGQAWYFNLGLSHSFAVYKDWSLDLAGTVSYLLQQIIMVTFRTSMTATSRPA